MWVRLSERETKEAKQADSRRFRLWASLFSLLLFAAINGLTILRRPKLLDLPVIDWVWRLATIAVIATVGGILLAWKRRRRAEQGGESFLCVPCDNVFAGDKTKREAPCECGEMAEPLRNWKWVEDEPG